MIIITGYNPDAKVSKIYIKYNETDNKIKLVEALSNGKVYEIKDEQKFIELVLYATKCRDFELFSFLNYTIGTEVDSYVYEFQYVNHSSEGSEWLTIETFGEGEAQIDILIKNLMPHKQDVIIYSDEGKIYLDNRKFWSKKEYITVKNFITQKARELCLTGV